MSIHERKTKTGTRYDVKIRRPDGTQYQRSFRTKREAAAFETTELADQRRGAWLDNRTNKITFAQYAETWLASNPDKRSRTRLRDEGIITKHLNPSLGARRLKDIKHSDLRTLINQWSTNGLSPNSIKRHRAVLSAIFRMAVRDEMILKSPVEGLSLPRAEPSSGWALTSEEARRLLEAMAPAYVPLVYILLTTGLRWSEAAGLEIRHFNSLSTTPTLTVNQGLHEVTGGTEISPPKSAAAYRTIPLTAEQVRVISRHIEDTGRTGATPHEPLFVSPRGKVVRHSNFRDRIWRPAIKRAGLEGLKIHDLRKTAITNLLQAGIDPKTITVLAGHEDLRTTLHHYAKATPQSLLAASQVLVEATRPGEKSDRMAPLSPKEARATGNIS
jgi:integrase